MAIRRGNSRYFCALALLAACLATATCADAEILFQTATSGPTGQTCGQGLAVDSNFFPGTRFQLTQPAVTSAVGGHFLPTDFVTPRTVFGAIVRLTGPDDFADSADLSTTDVLGTTLITVPPTGSTNVSGPLVLSLSPGWYALEFGSGRFGATGDSGLISGNSLVGTPDIFSVRQSDGNIAFQASEPRMFVEGTSVPEPGTGGILLALIVMSVRRRVKPRSGI